MEIDTPKQPTQPEICPRCGVRTEAENPFCSRCKLDLRYGSPNRITSGTCVYCGYTGALSREHIFGRWLNERYKRTERETRHDLTRPDKHAFWGEFESIANSEHHRSSGYSEVVHNVCEDCNNGWMSSLQNEAQPVVASLADGFWPRFTEPARHSLVRWVAMVMINLETKARMSTSSHHQRKSLMGGDVPPGILVSLGRVASPVGGHSFQRKVQLPIRIGDDFLTASSTVFVIEKAAFHCLCSIGDSTVQLVVATTPSPHLPRPIWPIDPGPRISNKEIMTVAAMDKMQLDWK